MTTHFRKKASGHAIFICLLLMAVFTPLANATVVNFDFTASGALVDTSGGPVTGAGVATYLAGFGITMTGLNGDPLIFPAATWENTSSSPNVFAVGGVYPAMGTWTFNFNQPVNSVSFVRVGLSGPGGQGFMGAWSATAYSGASIVGSVSEPGYWGGESSLIWKTFGLGSGIDSIVFGSYAIGTYLPIDDLTFTPVPEPGTLLLLGSGLVGLVGFGRKRSPKTQIQHTGA